METFILSGIFSGFIIFFKNIREKIKKALKEFIFKIHQKPLSEGLKKDISSFLYLNQGGKNG
jgi:hypothetical protein